MLVDTAFRTEVTVAGISCPHCVSSVTADICEIDGVSAVDVSLETGAVTVLADRDVAREEIATALASAGFELAG